MGDWRTLKDGRRVWIDNAVYEEQKGLGYCPPPEYVKLLVSDYESFVVPNATCPVCGAPVFYYTNKYGSSVFFDELGPPWDKHPCTDNGKMYKPGEVSAKGEKGESYLWMQQGWVPIKVLHIRNKDSGVTQVDIKAVTNEASYSILVKSDEIKNISGISELYSEDTLALIKLEGSVCAVSVLLAHGEPYEFQAKVIENDHK